MRRLRMGTLAALALASVGCLRESTIEPIRETVMVHAMVAVGDTTLAVALSTVSSSGVPAPLYNAMVRLQRDDVETVAIYSTTACYGPSNAPDGTACYAGALATPIQPGETIELDIELPDGTRITGSTTTPVVPQIEQPVAGSDVPVLFVLDTEQYEFLTVEQEPIEVRWTGNGSGPADVLLDIGEIFDDGAETHCDDFDYHDATHTRSPAYVEAPFYCMTSAEDPAWDSAYVTVRVVDYDENARAYIAATNETGIGIVLDGAAPGLEVVTGNTLVSGVFGAAAGAGAPVTLRAVISDRR